MEYFSFSNVVEKMDSKMKKTILFCLPNLNGGGAEKVLINIMKYNYLPEKYNIKLLLVDNIGVYFDVIPNYIEIISLDVKRVRNALIPFINKVNEIKPDIIFTTTNRMNILVLLASYFFSCKPEIIIREPNLPSAQIKNKILKWWHIILIKFLYKKADKIIAQTYEMKEEICIFFNTKCEKVEVMINPIDKNMIDKMVEDTKNPFEKKYINLISIGRLSYQKGFDILIKAFSKVIEKNKNYRLYILGEGEDKEKLQNLIKELGLKDYVFLLGFQKNPYIYMKYADALVLSSRWEGLPNVVLESIYLGTKVICTKIGKTIEKIVEENNGFLVEVENVEDLKEKILKIGNKND
jgi:glycosyltransferase involved in cell wall biosynthesis